MTTYRRLVGKVAVITASSTGIGYAIAERFAQEGAKVVISSRKKQNVDAAVEKLSSQGMEAIGIVCHVGKKEDRQNLIEQTVKHYGGLDILVSNAAVSTAFGPILSVTEEQMDKILDVNVKAALFLIKEAVPHMEKRGGGNILLIGSQGGYYPGPALGIYGISKTALLGLTKALVHQLAPLNIRVNCIAPGLIQTEFSASLWNNEEFLSSAMERTPMRRIGQPSEIGAVAAFLVSDDASYITGETLLVNGGEKKSSRL